MFVRRPSAPLMGLIVPESEVCDPFAYPYPCGVLEFHVPTYDCAALTVIVMLVLDPCKAHGIDVVEGEPRVVVMSGVESKIDGPTCRALPSERDDPEPAYAIDRDRIRELLHKSLIGRPVRIVLHARL